jgi:hypothetical protein
MGIGDVTTNHHTLGVYEYKLPEITIKDILSVFFVAIPGLEGLAAYDATLDSLIPKLTGSRFTSLVSCYYVNSHKYGPGVRLSCLVPTESVSEFISEVGLVIEDLGLHQVREQQSPKEITWFPDDEELELRYRRFLALQNAIGLDFLETDPLFARKALAYIRCRSKPWDNEFRPQLEPVLLALSPTYKSLGDGQRDSFFKDLATKPRPDGFAWFHQLVNLVLTKDPKFILKFRATTDEINRCLVRMNLPIVIPERWNGGLPDYEVWSS